MMSDPLTSLAVPVSPRRIELGADELQLWHASLDCDRTSLERLAGTLSADERARAARLVFERDRDHFIVARGTLRELLGAYLGCGADCVSFSYGRQGKPALLAPDGGQPELFFNVSHSQGMAIFAFARDRELGVDIEKIDPARAGEEIARRFFSRDEVAEFLALPPELKAEGFFRCWTRKEAYVKARGAGLQMALDSFSVSLSLKAPARFRGADCAGWTMYCVEAPASYVAALVAEGEPLRMRCRERRHSADGF